MNERNSKGSLTPEYFEDVYNTNDDPWNFASSDYEKAKYAATLAALPNQKYASALEVGCSIGVLTAQLAARCASLLAIDVNEKALAQARHRCRNLSNVTFAQRQIPQQFPAQNFELILISEVGYYLSVEDWKKTAEQAIMRLNPQGNILLIHWTPPVADYPQTGDEVHDSFADWSQNQLTLIKKIRAEKYRLEVWEKT